MSASFNLHRPTLNKIRVDVLRQSENTAVLEVYNEAATVSATLFFNNIDELHDFVVKALVLVDEKRNEMHAAGML
jgi:hypothetical protein